MHRHGIGFHRATLGLLGLLWMTAVLALSSCAESTRDSENRDSTESAELGQGEAGSTSDSADKDTRPPEAFSLTGEPLYRMEMGAEQTGTLEANLAAARTTFDEDSADPENIIWLGRRLAYLWRYQDAVEVFSRGIEQHPGSYKLLRHRGHRLITMRDFDGAIADFEKAVELIEGVDDEVEPDGAPNAANKPRSTSHSNIWYHLGLAYYLTGQFEKAADAYEHCLEFSRNDDMLVATLDWQYMTLRRLQRNQEAKAVLDKVHEEMDILENHSYHRRLLMYKGVVEPEGLLNPQQADALELATQGYGVANWYFVNGETEKAEAILRQILEGDYWAAFGYIAAEADLRRFSE